MPNKSSGCIILVFLIVTHSFGAWLVNAMTTQGTSSTAINCWDMCSGTTQAYEPICATNGTYTRTFGNMCYFNKQNCPGDNIFEFLYDGECIVTETPSTTPEPTWTPPLDDVPTEKSCPDSCPEIWEPLCASNGTTSVTFASECNLEVQNCPGENVFQLQHYGECQVDPGSTIGGETFTTTSTNTPPCAVVNCMALYKPICGSDGINFVTFPNVCQLEAQNCLGPNVYTKMYDGECCRGIS